MKKNELKISCLNFQGNKNEELKKTNLEMHMESFIKNEKADIIAGQELLPNINNESKNLGSGIDIEGKVEVGSKFFTGFCIKDKTYNTGLNSYAEMEEIWRDLFEMCSTSRYRSAYFTEKWIKFCGKNIRLINVHLSLSYEIELRLSLLEYLSRLQNKYTIIMGDFNAAEKWQTSNYIEGNDKFLKKMKSRGYFELLNEKEQKGRPHYTHYCQEKGRKLDHIFLSNAFEKDFETRIEYNDNINHTVPGNKNSNAFTDHSAIRLTIKKK